MKLHTKCYGSVGCHICFYQMSPGDMDAFKEHLKKHSKVQPKQCVICDEANLLDLRYHVQGQVSVSKVIIWSSSSLFICSFFRVCVCTRISQYELPLILDFDAFEYFNLQHNEANLLCDLCGKTFLYTSSLNKHRKSHIDDRPEQCPYCPKAFKFRRSLKEHLDTHVSLFKTHLHAIFLFSN